MQEGCVMRRHLFLLVVALAAGVLMASEAQEESAELKLGQRVRLVLDSGQSFTGVISGLSAKTVILDFSFEKSGFLGMIGFERASIRRVVPLPSLSRDRAYAELSKRDKERKKAGRAHRAWMEARKERQRLAEAEQLSRAETAKVEKVAAELARQKALLAEFPEGEGWGPERLTQIMQRSMTLNQLSTSRERRFIQAFSEWVKAKAAFAVLEEKKKAFQQELLAGFPPEAGWGPERLAEIEAKQAADQGLSPGEIKFQENYAKWEAAREALAPVEVAPAPQPMASPPASSMP